MPTGQTTPDLSNSLLLAFATNERINQLLLDSLPDGVWTAKAPESPGRAIAAIFAHMHNVRLMWLKAIAKQAHLPVKLNRATVTKQDAKDALAASHSALADVLRTCLVAGDVPNFSAGPAGLIAYLIAHDAHHRGQICTLARQLGACLSDEVTIAMWDWPKRTKEAAVDYKS
jgi:uncharacterized damage-inducible protein DinB